MVFREQMKPLSLTLRLRHFLHDSSGTVAALVLKAEAFSLSTFMFRTWFLCSVSVELVEEWVDEVGEVTAIRVIFHDEWQVIRPALISFHSSRGIRSASGNVSLPESFNFHFFKTKVSLRPVGISSRLTLPHSLLSTVVSFCRHCRI